MIIDKNPQQLKFDLTLWTRRAVKALIRRQYQIELSLHTLGVYLRSWGLSVQRPVRRAIERNDQRVLQWKSEQYPEIAKRAKLEGAVIY